MSEQTAEWYLGGEGDLPVGPMSADALFMKYRQGEIGEQTLCWREGLADWQPLEETPPFDRAIRKLKSTDVVRFNCDCGHEIIMARQFAGRRAQCHECGRMVVVPGGKAAPPPLPASAAPGLRVLEDDDDDVLTAIVVPERRRISPIVWIVAAGIIVVGGIAAALTLL